MSTATTTSHDTGQQTSLNGQCEAQQSVAQQKHPAAKRLLATMDAVKRSFT